MLVTASPAALLATVRSRCQKIRFHEAVANPLDEPDNAEWIERLARVERAKPPELLDWAEEFRGARAPAAAAVERLLDTSSAWIRARVFDAVSHQGQAADFEGELELHRELSDCRKTLVQRNANPQMVAERALFAIHDAVAR